MVSSLIQFIARISFYSLRIVLTSASVSAASSHYCFYYHYSFSFFPFILFHPFLVVAMVVLLFIFQTLFRLTSAAIKRRIMCAKNKNHKTYHLINIAISFDYMF